MAPCDDSNLLLLLDRSQPASHQPAQPPARARARRVGGTFAGTLLPTLWLPRLLGRQELEERLDRTSSNYWAAGGGELEERLRALCFQLRRRRGRVGRTFADTLLPTLWLLGFPLGSPGPPAMPTNSKGLLEGQGMLQTPCSSKNFKSWTSPIAPNDREATLVLNIGRRMVPT